MNSLLGPIILIILSFGLYFTYTDKEYKEVKALQTTNAQYEAAISNANNLLKERDELLAKYNAIPADDLTRLEKLLPDNIDNVRLIIEVNAIMQRLGIPAQNVKVDIPKDDPTAAPDQSTKPYNSASLTFTVSASYTTFISLLKEIQSSLRMLDITEIKVSASDKEPYQYTFTINTYWMK